MRWASAISDRASGAAALEEAVASVRGRLDRLDLAVVFASPSRARDLVSRLNDVPAATLIGCSGAGIIGDAREIEDRPAVSVTAAELPGVTCTAFRVEPDAMPADADAWRALIGVDDPAGVLVLADPFSGSAQRLIDGLDAAFPRARKFGGLASGGRAPGADWLFAHGESFRAGAVGVAFTGDVAIDTIVAQGCRPIGAPMVVTRGEGNLILELDHRSPLDVLQALHDSLDARDRGLFRDSLFIGIEMKDSLVHHEGELLVRNIIGVDPEANVLAVAARVRPFQVIRFLLRDARAATEDLVRLLEGHRVTGHGACDGALLFSCLGRGAHLFGEPDHDSRLFRQHLGEVAVGGFFCNGEIGPVGGTTFLHGYTSSFALFRRA
ncbi:MAG TPA: FIST N-terminal domain-containing protein [Kofleriaceae bacterium]|nr:FIST N-terminal domain-containing protein [Kofleriaceae bacterium]